MIDDVLTDDTVSWSPGSDNSFIVWSPVEFCSVLLFKHFRHNSLRTSDNSILTKVDPKR
ncbi:hypothetical protein ZOSMA_15G01420 [Zostera marina]|uniref:HSF-type DNA-binding domain-containing protein n=1 Tax=Zostera marina TaxID=29655 RepID=A0A0K9PUU0_ZOSMR|nr:hypothetical protein ZOSMA_15G01420 [Zostera marina]